MVGLPRERPKRRVVDTELIGSAAEVTVEIEGVKVAALLDTGSTLSTVSIGFYQYHLTQLPLHPIADIILIECADGEQLPYHGYIEAAIDSAGVPSTSDESHCFPLSEVPDRNYNKGVPLLIGTNVLQHLFSDVKGRFGERFLQQADLHDHILSLEKCAAVQYITIPPNTSVTVPGFIDKALPYEPTPVILHPTVWSIIPRDLEITPAVTDYTYPAKNKVEVSIDNVTTRTVHIPPRALLCEIQPISIEDIPQSKDVTVTNSVFDLVTMDTENLTFDQLNTGRELLQRYEDVFFSKFDTDIGHTEIATHHIDITDETLQTDTKADSNIYVHRGQGTSSRTARGKHH